MAGKNGHYFLPTIFCQKSAKPDDKTVFRYPGSSLQKWGGEKWTAKNDADPCCQTNRVPMTAKGDRKTRHYFLPTIFCQKSAKPDDKTVVPSSGKFTPKG